MLIGKLFITQNEPKQFTDSKGREVNFVAVRAIGENGDTVNMTCEPEMSSKLKVMERNAVELTLSSKKGYPKLKIVNVLSNESDQLDTKK